VPPVPEDLPRRISEAVRFVPSAPRRRTGHWIALAGVAATALMAVLLWPHRPPPVVETEPVEQAPEPVPLFLPTPPPPPPPAPTPTPAAPAPPGAKASSPDEEASADAFQDSRGAVMGGVVGGAAWRESAPGPAAPAPAARREKADAPAAESSVGLARDAVSCAPVFEATEAGGWPGDADLDGWLARHGGRVAETTGDTLTTVEFPIESWAAAAADLRSRGGTLPPGLGEPPSRASCLRVTLRLAPR
jgi:hypothetical protein